MSEEKKQKYRIGAAGGYIYGILHGEGQIVECTPKEASKTWTAVDDQGNPLPKEEKKAEPAPEPAKPSRSEEDDPHTMFGHQQTAKSAAKRRGEE